MAVGRHFDSFAAKLAARWAGPEAATAIVDFENGLGSKLGFVARLRPKSFADGATVGPGLEVDVKFRVAQPGLPSGFEEFN